jgi:hypothetical protein
MAAALRLPKKTGLSGRCKADSVLAGGALAAFDKVRCMTDAQDAIKPWYKQPWLWFLLIPLIAVFIYGFVFLYLSIVTMDGVVKDDYYRIARGYEVNSEKNQNAIEHNLTAEVRMDDVTGDVQVVMKGDFEQWPATLTLDVVHPTHQQYDQAITLKALPGQAIYSGFLTSELKGKRFLFLFPEDQAWHLRQEIQPPYAGKEVLMTPTAVQ